MTEKAGLQCDTVLLAAGFSTRMKQWKPALRIGDKTVIQRTIENARAAGGRIIVVGGERFEDLRELLKPSAGGAGNEKRKIVMVRNPDPGRGMLSSVQTGAAEVQTERYFIALGDMPFVSGSTYRKLMKAAVETDGDPAGGADTVIVPRRNGKDGHPVLLSQQHTAAVLKADCGTQTPRDVLGPFPKRYVDVDDKGIKLDLDTPADYRRICGTDLP